MCRYHTVISVEKSTEGRGKNAIFAALANSFDIEHVFVVDEDVDIYDPEEVEWASRPAFRPSASCSSSTAPKTRRYVPGDLFAPPASGVSIPDATLIVPASVSKMGDIANGTGTDLPHGVADATLKERKPLIILEREMPCDLLRTENMAAVTEGGGGSMSAAPGFYNRPETLEDVVGFVVGELPDTIGAEHDPIERWGRKRREREIAAFPTYPCQGRGNSIHT